MSGYQGTYVGLMSGTSMDAMDALLVEFSGKPKLSAPSGKGQTAQSPKYKILARASLPVPEELRGRIHQFNQSEASTLAELAICEREIAELAALATDKVLAAGKKQPKEISAIAFAGQTIGHSPSAGWTKAVGDANLLAEKSGIKVVADFRQRDIVAGGDGAPLASHFHHSFLSAKDEARGILNLGGIGNITLLQPGKAPVGFDLGPANCLIDEWTQANKKGDLDKGGRWAAQGKVVEELLALFLEDEFFSKPPPKTTGRDYFCMDWLKDNLAQLDKTPKPEDVQASLCELTALSVSLATSTHFDIDEDEKCVIYVGGGGAHNDYLMQRIDHLTPCPAKNINELGIDAKDLEALAFAWLAHLRVSGIACDLSSVTGSSGPRHLGAIYE